MECSYYNALCSLLFYVYHVFSFLVSGGEEPPKGGRIEPPLRPTPLGSTKILTKVLPKSRGLRPPTTPPFPIGILNIIPL